MRLADIGCNDGRHVRVHHTDKDRNDPALQDVLYGGSHLLSKALTSEQRLK